MAGASGRYGKAATVFSSKPPWSPRVIRQGGAEAPAAGTATGAVEGRVEPSVGVDGIPVVRVLRGPLRPRRRHSLVAGPLQADARAPPAGDRRGS